MVLKTKLHSRVDGTSVIVSVSCYRRIVFAEHYGAFILDVKDVVDSQKRILNWMILRSALLL